MIQYSLYDSGSFVIPLVLDDELFLPQLPDEQEEDALNPTSVEPLPVVPNYREREWMLQQAAGIPGSVGIFRSSKYRIRNEHNAVLRLTAVRVIPFDLAAASLCIKYQKQSALQELEIVNPISKKVKVSETTKKKKKKSKSSLSDEQLTDGSHIDYTLASLSNVGRCCVTKPIFHDGKNPLAKMEDHRLYFPINNMLAEDVENSFLVRHLQQQGFNVIVSPSLSGYLKRELLRRKIDATPFLLPEITDSRPLFEKLETGLILRCTSSTGEFTEGLEYVVVNTAFAESEDDAEGEEIVRLKATTADPKAVPLTWTAFDGDMDNYFILEYEKQTVYDPPNCLPEKFPRLFSQAQKRLEKLNLPLFQHTAFDAAQVSVKDHAFLGKPMRMGKTREALATSMIWDSKRIGFISPGIARMDVWDELAKVGRQDKAIIVKTVDDLNKDAQFYLMTLPWLKWKDDPLKEQRYTFPKMAICPHCQEPLMRPTKTVWKKLYHTDMYGYRCANRNCKYNKKVKRTNHGLTTKCKTDPVPWTWTHDEAKSAEMTTVNGDVIRGGYVDYERAKHVQTCIQPILNLYLEEKDENVRIAELFRGRQCKHCGYVASAWKPPRYRRVNKHRWGTMIVDEIHAAKNPSSDQGRAIVALKAKHRLGLTGTLMPNTPQDPYWPLHWIFGGGTYRFPYFRSGDRGLMKWNRDFTSVIEMVDKESDTVKRRRLPYLSSPLAFWKLMAPFMIRRSYEDSLVKESLEAAGLYYPTVIPPKTLLSNADPKQAALMLSAMDKFQEHYEKFKDKAAKDGKQLQAQTVLTAMSLMKVVATCPDHLNAKLLANGVKEKIYTGVPGGGKMKDIKNLVWTKIQNNEKVVVLSFYREMLKVLETELADFSPVRFDPAWDEEKRYEMRKAFQDPNGPYNVFIAGINTVQVSVDLSAADTVICADLLWTPGLQQQAWSRILQPTPLKRTCEIYLSLLKHSIDKHIYNVFYSKLVAAEQALDRQVTTKKDKGLDIQWFVDQIMADRPHIMEYLIEAGESDINYTPLLEMVTFEDHEE